MESEQEVTMGVVSPGELQVGMFVTVLEDNSQKDSDDSLGLFGLQSPPRGKYTHLKGIPFEVKAVCNPFAMCHIFYHGGGGLFGMGSSNAVVTIDLREVVLMQVTAEYHAMYLNQKQQQQQAKAKSQAYFFPGIDLGGTQPPQA